ncbi:hypothetical protein BKA70DRAFT_1437047 [Coprinopsis sp. MPI-PUGE-AT-0042]|nr:hypothetical protein BKA70DRAFT_1437047 [Coprinopsis sp. MPI-PUGE-AT-0042]
MAKRGPKEKYTTAEAKAEAIRCNHNAWWGRNGAQVNRKRREDYARKKEQAGKAVRQYTHKKKVSTKAKASSKKLEREVDSPHARASCTANPILSRARSVINEMRVHFDGTKEAYFTKVCEDYINCTDLNQGTANIERASRKFEVFIANICQFEHEILNSVGSWSPQMKEYQGMRTEVQEAANMVKEIYKAALEGGKEGVFCRATESLFTFQLD